MIKQISVHEILASYNDKAPLSEASTIPGPWYVDRRIAELEAQTYSAIPGRWWPELTRWKSRAVCHRHRRE